MTGLLNIFSAREVMPLIVYGAGIVVFLVWAAGRMSKLTSLRMLTEPGLFITTGKMGRGKSYLMTLFIFYAMRQRRVIFANYFVEGCKSYDEFMEWIDSIGGREIVVDRAGKPIGWRIPDEHKHTWNSPVTVSNWTQVIDAPNGCMTVIDEAQSWWDSGAFAAPGDVKDWVTRLRKRKITCLCGAQDFTMLSRWLRILAAGVWECRRTGSVHRYTLVDTSQVGKSAKTQKFTARFRCRRKRRVMALYDTFEAVGASREWGGITDPETVS